MAAPWQAICDGGCHVAKPMLTSRGGARRATADPVVELEQGVVVADRFRLDRELGRGGMGAVWVAHHLSLDIPCAIKFIIDQRLDRESRARFKAEARAAAKLRSTHVVQVYEHGVWNTTPYIAMELLEGESLADRLDRVGRLGMEDTYRIASQVGHALTRAAQLGVVHRDLKPDNIFLAADGNREIVKVLDFGVAKLPGGGMDGIATQTGAVIGTPNYLSPEQAHGAKTLDHRSDLYAVAVIVYECITGQLAFDADGLGALLSNIVTGKVSRPSEVVATLPPALDVWFFKAAATDPADRFQSATEMIHALGDAIGYEGLRAVSSRPGYAATALGSDSGDTAPRPAAVRGMSQQVAFCRADDGVRLAYAAYGEGPPLVKVANWLSHLELDWSSPVWRHWLDFFCARRRLLRYDARGNGLSEWEVEHIDFERYVDDLGCVMDAGGIDRAPVLAISQGAAVAAAYAARHPGRVSGLVLVGGYARGWRAKDHAGLTEQFEALMTLMRHQWGQDSPAFRRIFTKAFFPESSPSEMAYFDELQRRTTTPDNAARILDAVGAVDVRAELPRVSVPTLVLHSTGDQIAPIKDGMELAAGIPGARFVSLDSPNHLLLNHEPAWGRFRAEVDRFLSSLDDVGT